MCECKTPFKGGCSLSEKNFTLKNNFICVLCLYKLFKNFKIFLHIFMCFILSCTHSFIFLYINVYNTHLTLFITLLSTSQAHIYYALFNVYVSNGTFPLPKFMRKIGNRQNLIYTPYIPFI